MSEELTVLEGGCSCGAVRYEICSKPTYVGICHCDDCRRATGGAYVPWFGAEPMNFNVTKGSIVEHVSSPRTTRGFCGTCGSSLTFGGANWNDISVTLASLDAPNALTPQSNVFLREKLPWVLVNEDMRNSDGFPEEVKSIR